MIPDPSLALLIAFCSLLALTLACLLAGIVRFGGARPLPAMALLAVWLLATGALAASGTFARWELRPPPGAVVMLVGLALTVALCRRPFARRLATHAPLAFLIGLQAFRLPLELIMHRAWREGLMPIQMSFSGWNFDIATGLLALTLGLVATRRTLSVGAVRGFNTVGLLLLATIVGIAIVSTPPIAAFGPERLNVWVTTVPFVWLPAVFVLTALFGHLVLAHRLGEMSRGR